MANEGLNTVVPSIGPCLGGTIELWVDLMVPEVLDLGPDTVFCDIGELLINLPRGFSAQIWSTGSTAEWMQVPDGGMYSVYADDAQGCKVYDEIALDLVECLPAMPTVFTPNGDGVNDVIRLDKGGRGTSALLLIFDRNGAV
ncbi:MAG: hypothetical protein KDC03_13135, partial [Flavobacteriales bacterium]|nr:hypothetical protein [Flavobacteriales bacterium]